MRAILTAMIAVLSYLAVTFPAQAVPVSSRLVLKVSDATPGAIDPNADWINNGGFNMGTPGAKTLLNNGIDFKDSFVDTNWIDVLTVRVSMYNQGNEVAFIEFDAAGTTKTDFFAQSNVTASNWALLAGGHNFFSIPGGGFERHWFVNTQYGGCGNDSGHFLVLDGSNGACPWENTRSGAGKDTRLFLYSTLGPTDGTFGDGAINWNDNTGGVGQADVFAVHVTTHVDLPATAAMSAAGVVTFVLLSYRRQLTRRA